MLRARSTVVCVGSPITIGALSATAPPSEARSATGQHVPAQRAGLDDRTLIDAVRAGNLHAYGTLYERHVGAVRGLARRLCGNRADADDVVADVFTNTLRAIKSGRGPRDDRRCRQPGVRRAGGDRRLVDLQLHAYRVTQRDRRQ